MLGNVCNRLLQLNAAIVRGLTCCKILARHWALRKIWSTKFPLGGEVNHIQPVAYTVVLFDFWNPCKTFTKIVNMVAIFAAMFLYFGCPKEPSHWYGTFERWYFFVFQRYKLYSSIIYYDERSLLLSGSYSGCIYRFHFCVSNIKALHRYHFLWRKKSW